MGDSRVLSKPKQLLSNANKKLTPFKESIVDSANLLNNPLVQQARMLKRKQLAPLAGNILGGSIGQAGVESAQRGWRTANRVRGGLKKKGIGFVRGFRTGIKKNSRNIADVFTGNAFTAANLSKNLLQRSRYANTRVGKALLSNVGSYVPPSLRRANPFTNVQARRVIRRSSGGLFNRNNNLTNFQSLPNLSTFSIEYRGRTFPGYNKPTSSWNKNKKKAVLVKQGDKVKVVHYGHKGYEDYTQHKDKKRRKNYLTRSAGIRDKDGNLTKDNKFSSNYWARRDLW